MLIGNVVNLRVGPGTGFSGAVRLFSPLGWALAPGIAVLLLASALMGVLGAVLDAPPGRLRCALLQAIMWIILVGLLRELITTVLQNWGSWAKLILWMFAASGLSIIGALFLLVVVGGICLLALQGTGQAARKSRRPLPRVRYGFSGALLFVAAIIVLLLPRILGIFLE